MIAVDEDGKISSELVQAELDRLCKSAALSQSERLKRFLRYTVEMSREGNPERLKESVIGTEVFDRALGYNPKADAIVRVEAHRLRQKLDRYYAKEGATAKIRFVLPKGKYTIQIVAVPYLEAIDLPAATALADRTSPAAPNRLWKEIGRAHV